MTKSDAFKMSAVLAVDLFHYYSLTARAIGVYSFGHSVLSSLHDSPKSVEIKIP
jgi:hypothetical protein